MKIKLDNKHYLNSDRYCFWITKEQTVQEGKHAGEITEILVSGYHSSISSAVLSYFDKSIIKSEMTDLNGLMDEISQSRRTIHNWFNRLESVANEWKKGNTEND